MVYQFQTKLETQPDSQSNNFILNVKKMRRTISSLLFFHMALLLLCSGSIVKVTKATDNNNTTYLEEANLKASVSTKQKDITSPVTTVPTSNPATQTSRFPTSNPSDSVPTIMNPANPETTPLETNPPVSSRSWCIAIQSASHAALQVALDYACGHGADCSAIQPGGGCFNPSTVHEHASYAFNSYYQKNPIQSSCNFGGTAVTTNTDPSSVTCQYPSTSTTSSILNTTNSNGAQVFGAGRPITPTTSSAKPNSIPYYRCILVCFMSLLALQNVIHETLPVTR